MSGNGPGHQQAPSFSPAVFYQARAVPFVTWQPASGSSVFGRGRVIDPPNLLRIHLRLRKAQESNAHTELCVLELPMANF